MLTEAGIVGPHGIPIRLQTPDWSRITSKSSAEQWSPRFTFKKIASWAVLQSPNCSLDKDSIVDWVKKNFACYRANTG